MSFFFSELLFTPTKSYKYIDVIGSTPIDTRQIYDCNSTSHKHMTVLSSIPPSLPWLVAVVLPLYPPTLIIKSNHQYYYLIALVTITKEILNGFRLRFIVTFGSGSIGPRALLLCGLLLLTSSNNCNTIDIHIHNLRRI